MELSFSHSHNQRILRQRNMLAVAAAALAAITIGLFLVTISRDREVVLQPVLRSPLTVSSAGVSREYLEMITRDTVVLTLDRSPQNLEYWMSEVLEIITPRIPGRSQADLLRSADARGGTGGVRVSLFWWTAIYIHKNNQ